MMRTMMRHWMLTGAALGEGLELIRELIAERGRRREFDDQAGAPHDD